jgi:hypothetical protein
MRRVEDLLEIWSSDWEEGKFDSLGRGVASYVVPDLRGVCTISLVSRVGDGCTCNSGVRIRVLKNGERSIVKDKKIVADKAPLVIM